MFLEHSALCIIVAKLLLKKKKKKNPKNVPGYFFLLTKYFLLKFNTFTTFNPKLFSLTLSQFGRASSASVTHVLPQCGVLSKKFSCLNKRKTQTKERNNEYEWMSLTQKNVTYGFLNFGAYAFSHVCSGSVAARDECSGSFTAGPCREAGLGQASQQSSSSSLLFTRRTPNNCLKLTRCLDCILLPRSAESQVPEKRASIYLHANLLF